MSVLSPVLNGEAEGSNTSSESVIRKLKLHLEIPFQCCCNCWYWTGI